MTLTLKDFSYDYPEDLVAKYPADRRDDSRLLTLDRANKSLSHRKFSQIVDHFQPGDVLVLNDSKVFPSRLVTKRPTGGRQEILLVRQRADESWDVLINANKKVKRGDAFAFDGLTVTILDDPSETDTRVAKVESKGPLLDVLSRIAQVPLPPYFHRDAEAVDTQRYQTVFAKDTGSVAAPTAGLHFTQELLQKLKDKGVHIVFVTLHVGPGTFLPVRTDRIEAHKMHSEFYSLSQETCEIVNAAKRAKRPVTAVGTTAVRVLESVARETGKLVAKAGETDIFIYPPYPFQIVDHLITNFHQPESTLLMLVSAFAGREWILKAYQEAIRERYRLFSYGDAMLIL